MFKRMDEGGDACREREGKDLVRGGEVKNWIMKVISSI